MYQPRSSVFVTRINLAWFDDQCRHAFGLKEEAHLRWTRDCSRVNWEEFVSYQVRANETYSDAKRQVSHINKDVLIDERTVPS